MSIDAWEVLKLAAGGAGWAGFLFQIWNGRRTVSAPVINSLDAEFRYHLPVYEKMQQGGEWFGEANGPTKSEEFAAVKGCLDFFEKIGLMIDIRAVDMRTIDQMFACRFFHVVHNPHTHKIIEKCGDGETPGIAYFRGLCRLHERWLRFRGEESVPRRSNNLRSLYKGRNWGKPRHVAGRFVDCLRGILGRSPRARRTVVAQLTPG